MHVSQFDDARALVEHSKQELEKIRSAYAGSLKSQQISPVFLVEIKNLMENLRSALDFSAVGLFQKYGNGKPNAKIYFPYASLNQDATKFRAAGRIEACIPGITASRPDVVLALESVQHFAGAEWSWMPHFMELNNENKHQRLTPQTRQESRQLKLSSDSGAAIILGDGASIQIGGGAFIQLGDALIPGGQSISPTNPGQIIGGNQELTVWVSFHFSSNNMPVMPLLEQATAGVEKIVQSLAVL
ncbi:MAG: hypothetical protein A2Z93_13335 [Curvibacter sp. GWA2_64_110]|nr:MAG: hypothetical protein A2Z93_13335 [Curvibacter sp. GWA2_64_110]HCY17387.1 hypothetical protein [Curvibacter sp.]